MRILGRMPLPPHLPHLPSDGRERSSTLDGVDAVEVSGELLEAVSELWSETGRSVDAPASLAEAGAAVTEAAEGGAEAVSGLSEAGEAVLETLGAAVEVAGEVGEVVGTVIGAAAELLSGL